MDKEKYVNIHDYSVIKKNLDICDNMDRSRGHYSKLNKLEKDKYHMKFHLHMKSEK